MLLCLLGKSSSRCDYVLINFNVVDYQESIYHKYFLFYCDIKLYMCRCCRLYDLHGILPLEKNRNRKQRGQILIDRSVTALISGSCSPLTRSLSGIRIRGHMLAKVIYAN